jgi:hypothetical protein
MMYLHAAIIITGLLLAFSANAQTIYKCRLANGTLAYQDEPCAGGHGQVVQAAENDSDRGGTPRMLSPAQLSRMSLRELYDKTQVLSARKRQALAEVLRERKATSARLGTHVHATLPNPEAGMGGKTWESKLLVAQTELRQVLDEIRRRCPGGAAMNAAFQSCRK